jgi:phosphoribosylformimino-5-aminoimidazole carboxamide ribotide isomerase
MTRFRPCIDLHQGKVKQIVGGSLAADERELKTNFESDLPASHFAKMYCDDQLLGGHVIKLGPGNDEAARDALQAWPGALQLGGGINHENAAAWLSAGASQVIVTSFLFDEGRFVEKRLEALVDEIGADRLVIDLSCRRTDHGWAVAMNRWQTLTDMSLTPDILDYLAASCAEFLIHAADVEGKCQGIDEDLVKMLGGWARRPMVYAGGVRGMADLQLVDELSAGQVDCTVGSALDIFGGSLMRYRDCVEFNHRRSGFAIPACC